MKVASRSKAWRFFNSWWILLTFVFYLNWIAFMYISARAKKKSWAVWGFIYAIPFMMIFFELYDVNSRHYDFFMSTGIISTFISVFHGFYIRKDYLTRLQYRKAYDAEMDRRLARQFEVGIEDRENTKRTEDFTDEQEEVAAPQIKNEVPSFNEESNISSSLNHSGSVLDLNIATEQEISELPGVGIILAKKAINHRERNGEFRTVGDFFELLQLKQYAIDRLRPLVVVTEPPSLPPQTNHRRLVDY